MEPDLKKTHGLIHMGPMISWSTPNYCEKVVIGGLDTKWIRGCTLYDQKGERIAVPMHFDGHKLHIARNGLPKGIYCVRFNGRKNFSRIFIVPK